MARIRVAAATEQGNDVGNVIKAYLMAARMISRQTIPLTAGKSGMDSNYGVGIPIPIRITYFTATDTQSSQRADRPAAP